MKLHRAHNFSAGPARLPLEVLQKARKELLNYQGRGTSVMEMSHRSPEYTEIDRQAKQRLKELLGLDDSHHIMFLQGGASSQFMMVPYNFLQKDQVADYIDTGRWSDKAITEAELFGKVNVPFSSRGGGYRRISHDNELSLNPDAEYIHFTSNNTVVGTQFSTEPNGNGIPLVCDMSSDFLSRPINVDKYGLIYAGAQKNAGPAGVTIVIIRDEFLQKAKQENVPTILRYQTHAERIFNTPPVFAVYLANYVFEWIQEQGGLDHFAKINSRKADLIYNEIDGDDFYEGMVEKDSRSVMNVTFRLNDQDLEETFLQEAAGRDLIALKGHRSVGGIRASIYNACPVESIEKLVEFMSAFRNKHQ